MRVWNWKADSHVQFAKLGLGHFQYLAGDFSKWIQEAVSPTRQTSFYVHTLVGLFVRIDLACARCEQPLS